MSRVFAAIAATANRVIPAAEMQRVFNMLRQSDPPAGDCDSAPKYERNTRYEFVPDRVPMGVSGHDHPALYDESEEQGEKQGAHLYPEGFHVVVLGRGKTHELEDAGGQQDRQAHNKPPFGIPREFRQRLVPHSKSQEAQI